MFTIVNVIMFKDLVLGDTMTKRIGNVEYKTILDVAHELGVGKSTIRRYIAKGLLPAPDRRFFASQSVAVFSDEYVANAKAVFANLQK